MADEKNAKKIPRRRSVSRVQAEKLPPALREFQLQFNQHEVYRGETIDASATGISFKVEVPANRIREYLVSLTSADGKITMTQEIVYIKPIDASHSRISLMFDAESTPQLYRRLLRKALIS